jgi:hypothetical protein
VDDARCLDLPERGFVRIVFAGLAGGIDAVLQDCEVSLRAIGALRCKSRIVYRFHPKRIDEAVAIVLGQIDDLTVGDVAVWFGQPGIALRDQAFGFLVVDDLIRFNGGSAEIDLDVANGGNRIVRVVVFDLIRLNEHRRIRRCDRGFRLGRPAGKVQQDLGGNRQQRV